MASDVGPETRRNICFIGHSGAGKTALAETMLFHTHATSRIGKTLDGSSHLDFEPEEIKRGTTLKTSVYDFSHQGVSYSLIDTPGSTSFLSDTICALRGGDIALLVAGAVSGIKVQGEKAWEAAAQADLARAIFVTELDRERSNFEAALEQMRKALEITPVVVQLPIGEEHDLSGVVDLLTLQVYAGNGSHVTTSKEIPAVMKDRVQEARTKLIESIAETDDTVLEKYLSGQIPSESVLLHCFRQGFAERKLFPVFCGSAEKQVGITALLHAFSTYFPSPLERTPYRAIRLTTHSQTAAENSAPEVNLEIKADAPFSGIIFKTFADPFIGQISLLRVVSGTIQSDQSVFNSVTQSSERVGKLHLQNGKEHKVVDSAGPGHIVAISKLKETRTGHTLCSEKHPVVFPGFEFPESCMSFAIEPKSKGDEEKIFSAVEKISLEDPAIHIKRDPASHEAIISGVSQNHIEITLERIKRKFHVDVLLHAPKVPYRETIRKRAEAQGKHKKQSGGRGQFGDCWLRLVPRPRGAGFSFKSEIFGGAIPRNYIPAIEKGVIEAMHDGVVAGFPVVDLECIVYDGSYHAVDSSDLAFKIAASKGFKQALLLADPVILEPVMKAEIVVPDDLTGSVIGDINGRRGKVLGMEAKGHAQVIHAEVPLSEMLTYAADLRSISADRGSFHMDFCRYDELPAHLVSRLAPPKAVAVNA